MILKILLVIGLFLLYFFMREKGREREYFYLTVIMLIMREMSMPVFDSITPSTIMIFAILIGSFSKICIYLKQHMAYFFTLMFATLIGLLTTNFNYAKVTEWALLVSSVVVISALCQYFIRSEEELKKLTKCVITVCFIFSFTTIMAFHGFADGTVIISGFDTSNANNYHASRVYGITFSNLVQIISVISICLLPSLRLKRKWMEYLIIIVFVYAALITLKRMTFIAMAISLLLYLRQQIKIKNYKVIFIVTTCCAVLISMWWEPLMFRFGISGLGTGKLTDHSTLSRFYRIDYAVDAFEQSPILGMGAGYVIYVHNGFFEILANCGIIGIGTLFLKYIPKIYDILHGNAYAIATILYVITCFSLESAINHAQTIYFLGIFLGGYYVTKELEWQDEPERDMQN